ncbi:MAG: DUF4286 family protein [Prevotella sp.]|jgi:hypothetical protein|nr:DUF4286 family protein [Prevotella sp.]
MLIYNTTFHVDDEVRDSFLEHMTQRYIPAVAADRLVFAPCFARIHSQHEEQGASYSLQLKLKNTVTLKCWLETVGKQLQLELAAKFGDKVAGFATLLEEIEWNKK